MEHVALGTQGEHEPLHAQLLAGQDVLPRGGLLEGLALLTHLAGGHSQGTAGFVEAGTAVQEVVQLRLNFLRGHVEVDLRGTPGDNVVVIDGFVGSLGADEGVPGVGLVAEVGPGGVAGAGRDAGVHQTLESVHVAESGDGRGDHGGLREPVEVAVGGVEVTSHHLIQPDLDGRVVVCRVVQSQVVERVVPQVDLLAVLSERDFLVQLVALPPQGGAPPGVVGQQLCFHVVDASARGLDEAVYWLRGLLVGILIVIQLVLGALNDTSHVVHRLIPEVAARRNVGDSLLVVGERLDVCGGHAVGLGNCERLLGRQEQVVNLDGEQGVAGAGQDGPQAPGKPHVGHQQAVAAPAGAGEEGGQLLPPVVEAGCGGEHTVRIPDGTGAFDERLSAGGVQDGSRQRIDAREIHRRTLLHS
mmetsp:Transcript_11549/g.34665  ORF Transcript_11549/g.34665 Transcript_11549/m.34665 type:complete len:415 (+) Transcript_11549:1473-2717(+)